MYLCYWYAWIKPCVICKILYKSYNKALTKNYFCSIIICVFSPNIITPQTAAAYPALSFVCVPDIRYNGDYHEICNIIYNGGPYVYRGADILRR